MEGKRIRLRFEDDDILSESQKLEGLKRSWLLLPSESSTISDLSSHLICRFCLQDGCPNGVLLYMDGFVLPPFESTCIIKDKDIIRIKRKHGLVVDYGPSHIEEPQILEKQPVTSDVKLFTNQNQDVHDVPVGDALNLENGSIQNVKSKKKRKYSADHNSPKGLTSYCLALAHNSKKRKTTKSSCKDHLVTVASVEKDVQKMHKGKDECRGFLHQKRIEKMEKISNKDIHSDAPVHTDLDSKPGCEDDQLQITGKQIEGTCHLLDGTKKFPSRSARRKKAKRKWLRELANFQKKEVALNQMPAEDKPEASPAHHSPEASPAHHSPEVSPAHHPPEASPAYQSLDQNADIEDENEIVAVEIRPGHIRFEPLGKEKSNMELKDPVEKFQWSGTTCKRKGQKWGMEKSSKRNIEGDSDGISEKSINVRESKSADATVDFDKFALLTGKPQDGDIIAYRLVELSSSWCPELSSFRVGNISSYDHSSLKAVLVPVPEYPIVLDEKNDETLDLVTSNSLYNEDGTLEIDFSSLIDVRIINRKYADPMPKSGSLEAPAGCENATGSKKAEASPMSASKNLEVPNGCQDAKGTQEAVKGSNHATEITHPSVTENGGQATDVWDELSRALSEKKAQIQQNNDHYVRGSSAKHQWTNRGLRNSPMGPTIAMLRSQDGI